MAIQFIYQYYHLVRMVFLVRPKFRFTKIFSITKKQLQIMKTNKKIYYLFKIMMLFIILGIQVKAFSQCNNNLSCYTSNLELSTGWDGEANTQYAPGATLDNYWISNSNSFNSNNPSCSKNIFAQNVKIYDVQWPVGTNFLNAATTKSRKITINNGLPDAGPSIQTGCNGGTNGDYIKYTRTFQIGCGNGIPAGGATLNFVAVGDYYIRGISLIRYAAGGYITMLSQTFPFRKVGCGTPVIGCSPDPEALYMFNGQYKNVISQAMPWDTYFLTVELENDYASGLACISAGGNTPSHIQVEASLTTTIPNAIVNNEQFGRPSYCGGYYPLSYDYTVPTLANNNVICSNTYSTPITVKNGANTVLASGLTGVTYSVTAVGAGSGTFSTTAGITSVFLNGSGIFSIYAFYKNCSKLIGTYTLDVPTLIVSPSAQCVPAGSTGIITATGSAPGNPTFNYTLTKPPGMGLPTSSGLIVGAKVYNIATPVGVGIYTVSAIDANGCVAPTKTFKIGNIFTAALGVPPSNNICIPINGTATIVAGVTPILPNITYTPLGAGTTVVNAYSWSTSTNGTYSTVASDAGGCTNTAFISMLKSYSFTPTITGCVSPPTSSVVATISLTGTAGPVNFTVPSVGPLVSTGSIALPNFTTYTIIPSSLTGYCTPPPAIVSTTLCNCFSGIVYVNFPSSPANNLSTIMWPTGIAPTIPIRIVSNIIINANCNIFNNPNILIDPGVSITISDGKVLDIRNSVLYGCGKMWDGIIIGTATAVSPNIAALKVANSTLQDMENGIIQQSGLHVLNVSSNVFKNNGNQSILMKGDLGLTEIVGNLFTCSNVAGSPLLPPFNYTSLLPNIKRSKNGIVSIDPKAGKIGMSTLIANRNTFENLYCGIDIQNTSGNTALTNSTNIFNCTFNDIKNYDEPDLFNKTLNIFSASNGSAIYSNTANNLITKLSLKINTISNVYKSIFNGCDKGIVLKTSTPADISTNDFSNCLIGISSLQAKTYTKITNNMMTNVNLGVDCREPYFTLVQGPQQAIVNFNNITTSNVPLIKAGNTEYKFPIGIRMANTSGTILAITSTTAIQNISEIVGNTITMPCERGNCIISSDIAVDIIRVGHLVARNQVFLTHPANVPVNTYSLVIPGVPLHFQVGYLFESCKLAYCTSNKVAGNYVALSTAAWNTNNFSSFKSTGYLFYKSKDIWTSCNNVHHTARGMAAIGNCQSNSITQTSTAFGDLRINENKCNANRNPWLFEDDASTGGTIGSFGDVGKNVGGGGSVDCDNHFVDGGTNPTIDWRQRIGIDPMNLYRNSAASIPTGTLYPSNTICAQVNSGSTFGAYYNVTNIPAATIFNCPSSGTANKMGSFSTDNTTTRDLLEERDDAKDIVDHIIPFNVNQEVLHFMADQNLYTQLDKDETLRNADAKLSTFYKTNKYEAIGQLYDAQQLMLQSNNDETSIDDKVLYQMLAKAVLQQVNSTMPYITLQKDIMLLQLANLLQNKEAITEAQWEYIAGIAGQCPAAYGTGVYKARDLYHTYSAGLLYNDNVLCNANGNKNYDANEGETDSPITSGWVNVFPNPAHNNVNITYMCSGTKDGVIELYDIMGKLVSSSVLLYSSHDATINVSNMASGMYIYKAKLDGCGVVTGKIQINH
jgi:Secretion system C-terminal sorting domain